MIRVEYPLDRKSRSGIRSRLAITLLLLGGSLSLTRTQSALDRPHLSDTGRPSESTNSTAPLDAGTPLESVQEKLAKVRAEIATLNAVQPAPDRATSEISLRASWLQRLARLYEQEISYSGEIQTLKNRRAEFTQEAQSWTKFSTPRPYSILLTDSLRESIQVEQTEISTSESALSVLAKLIDEHRASLQHAEENIRQLNEKLERGDTAHDGAALSQRRELERLRSQTAAASVAVLDLERQIREERLATSRVRLSLLERQLVVAKTGVAFTDADMAAVAARLDGEQRQLEHELSEAETGHGKALQDREAAEEEWRRTQTNALAEPSVVAHATEMRDLRRAELEIADTARRVLHFMLQAGTTERIIWEARFVSYGNRNAAIIRETERRLDQLHRRTDLWLSFHRQQLEGAASQVALQEARLAALDPSSNLAPLLRERVNALRERDRLFLRVLRGIQHVGNLVRRSEEDLREATESLPFIGRARNAFSNSGSLLARIWDLELFAAQDTIVVDGQTITGKRSVTLGKIISAILIVVIGYWLTGLISRFTEKLVAQRFQIETKQASVIRRWLRVVLVFSLALFSLIWVKIPLTVFAFAGGALMIALGFGMQTLLKNFVSGVIILFERPFRVGDVLDVGGQRGTIVSVGIRSSLLQLWDNTEMLIPNSTLLENSVTNWTYSNRKVRFTVSVGVAYGSDTRRVIQLLTEIADRHGLVEKDPQPQIFFVDFGDSALIFEVRFWTDILKANAAQISSDLRQMIAITFAEQGIVIAFPQRDVHLDAARPLQVQVISPREHQPSLTPTDNKSPVPKTTPEASLGTFDGRSVSGINAVRP